jgi:hypothetical protein
MIFDVRVNAFNPHFSCVVASALEIDEIDPKQLEAV